MRSLVLVLAIVFVCAAVADAGPFDRTDTVAVGSTKELREMAAAALPGVTIKIKPGEYKGGLTFTGLRGTEGKRIVIAGLDPDDPPRFVGGNGLHLVNPAYLELRDIAITGSTGNGLNIDDGGSMKQTAYGIKLRRVVVIDGKRGGNLDGIKLSGLRGFTIEDCRVERWGSGGSGIDMVGCADGVIRGVTLKHGGPEATSTGIQCKGGTRDVVIERCTFRGAGRRGVNIGGSTGLQYFRPQPPAGYEAKDITVRRCTFVGVNAAVAFVGCDGALVEHNTIYRPGRWAMRILQETRADGFVPCRNGRFANNIVVWRSNEMKRAINIGSGTKPDTFEFTGNWWYCADRPVASDPNIAGQKGATIGSDPRLVDPDGGDLRPREQSPAGKVGAHAPIASE